MKSFLMALKFLTVIPLKRAANMENKRELVHSAAYFPVVGGLIGLMLVIVDSILKTFLPFPIVNLFILLALTLITGGLHLDG